MPSGIRSKCRRDCKLKSNCKALSGLYRRRCRKQCKSQCRRVKGSITKRRSRSDWRVKKSKERDSKNRTLCKSKGKIFYLTGNGYKCMTRSEMNEWKKGERAFWKARGE